MIPENFKTLIDKLKEKTAKREAIWSKTSREDEFKLNLGKGAITVDSWENTEEDERRVDIAVINERGDRIDYLAFSESATTDYKYLLELHSLAKGVYYKVDETFKAIFEELDSNEKVGMEKKADDDLPF